MQPEELQHSDAEIAATVAQELKSIFGVKGTPDFVKTVRYNRAMPQYHVGHLELMDRVDAQVAKLAGVELAGNSYRGVGIPHCIHSGEQAAERLLEFMSANQQAGTPVVSFNGRKMGAGK